MGLLFPSVFIWMLSVLHERMRKFNATAVHSLTGKRYFCPSLWSSTDSDTHEMTLDGLGCSETTRYTGCWTIASDSCFIFQRVKCLAKGWLCQYLPPDIGASAERPRKVQLAREKVIFLQRLVLCPQHIHIWHFWIWTSTSTWLCG